MCEEWNFYVREAIKNGKGPKFGFKVSKKTASPKRKKGSLEEVQHIMSVSLKLSLMRKETVDLVIKEVYANRKNPLAKTRAKMLIPKFALNKGFDCFTCRRH